jgi:4-amino-4-deoxy-L-arabinose transferase-like glycosyltransferase
LALAVFGIALAARGIYLWSVWDTPSVRYAMGDAEAYHERALAILAGNWLEDRAFYQDPLYPYFLAVWYALFGKGSPLVPCAQALLSSVSAVIVYWIGRAVFGTRSGSIAGLLAALYGPWLYYDALLLKVSLSLFLTTVAFALLLRADGREEAGESLSGPVPLPWLAAGYFFGLTALTRGNYLLFAPVLLAWVWWGRGASARRAFATCAVAAGLALAILPVTVHNAVVSHDFVLITSQAGQNFYIGNHRGNHTGTYQTPPFQRPNPRHEQNDMRDEAERRAGRQLSPSERSRFWFREGLAEIAADPPHAARLLLTKLRLFTSDYEVADNYSFEYFRRELSAVLRLPLPSWGVVFPLALCGIFFARRDRRALLLTLHVATYCVSLALFYMGSRYRMPVVPAVLVLAGEGGVQIAGALRARWWRRALPALLFLGVAWLLVYRPVMPQEDLALYRLKLGIHHARRAEAARERAVEFERRGDGAGATAARARDTELSTLAERELRRALDTRPNDEKIQNALLKQMVLRIRALQELAEHEMALEAATRLAEALPDRPIVQALLGATNARLGRDERAREILEGALEKWPDDPHLRGEWNRLHERSEVAP